MRTKVLRVFLLAIHSHLHTGLATSIIYRTIGYRVRISDSQKLSVTLRCWQVDNQNSTTRIRSRNKDKKAAALHHFPRDYTEAVALHLFFLNMTAKSNDHNSLQLFIMFSYSSFSALCPCVIPSTFHTAPHNSYGSSGSKCCLMRFFSIVVVADF